MSFIRISKPNANRASKRIRKVKQKTKPDWDSTITDQQAYKATTEDLEYRKAVHTSKHLMKGYLVDENISRERVTQNINPKQAVLKELLFDRQQLHDVLAKSDKMLEVVKDMFGDDPKRYTGFPSVTSAPGIQKENIHDLAEEVPELTSAIDTLSHSIMDETALNEDTIDDQPEALVYQSKMNLKRFQQFLLSQENIVDPSLSSIHPLVQPSFSNPESDMFRTPPRTHNESIALLRTPPSAVNDTKKINRKRPALFQKCGVDDFQSGTIFAPASASNHENTTQTSVDQNSNNSSIQEDILSRSNLEPRLKQAISNLKSELTSLGARAGAISLDGNDTFSGYTAMLVNAVTRLTQYIKQVDVQLRAESIVREQLSETVQDQRTLIDALTADLIATQEEYTKVLHEFTSYKLSIAQQQEHIVNCLKSAGIWKPLQEQNPPTSQVQMSSAINEPILHPNVESLASDDRVIILSPPVQKSRLTVKAKQPRNHKEVRVNVSNPAESIAVPKPTSLHDLLNNFQENKSDVSVSSSEHTVMPQFLPKESDYEILPAPQTFEKLSSSNTLLLTDNSLNVRKVHADTNSLRSTVNRQTLYSHLNIPHLNAVPPLASGYHGGNSDNNKHDAVAEHNEPDFIFNTIASSVDGRIDLQREREELAKQIEELNEQHKEAEEKLEQLRIQDSTSQSQSGVSPSLSSISQHTISSFNEPPSSLTSSHQLAKQTVMLELPRMEAETSPVSSNVSPL